MKATPSTGPGVARGEGLAAEVEPGDARRAIEQPGGNALAVVIELLLPAGGGEATERLRYNGPEYQQLSGLSASSAGVLLSTSPNDKHLALAALDVPGNVRRIYSGGITDLPAAGWTSSGSLIFGASVQGHLRIMALRLDGRVETVRTGPVAEVPLVVLGETILFGRFPGGESTIPFFETPFGRKYPDGELFRLAFPRCGRAAGTDARFQRAPVRGRTCESVPPGGALRG